MIRLNQLLHLMRQILNKRLIECLLVIVILVTCFSCKTKETYLKKDYLNLLSNEVGLSSDNDYLSGLINFGVVNKEEILNLDEELNYEFLAMTIGRLLGYKADYLKYLKDDGFIKGNKKNSDLVSKEIAEDIVLKTKEIINNKEFSFVYEYKENEGIKEVEDYECFDGESLITHSNYEVGDLIYLIDDDIYKEVVNKEEDFYVLKDPDFEDIYEDFKIENSYEINFDDAIDIPYGTIVDDEVYVNNDRQLLAASKLNKVFYEKGFRISYSFSGNSISAHISKNVNGINVFFDTTISNVRPSYKWDYENNKLNEAYFKIDYNTVTELGVSTGKYKNYYLDFKDLDTSNFLNAAKSVIKEKDDEVEASFKICEIKTPIPEIPSAFFNIEVLIKIYVSGKAEVVLSSSHVDGFEYKNGQLRLINDVNRDIDFKINASAKAALGLNFNLEAATKRLMDVELDAGIRAAVGTTLHLYDDEGNMTNTESELPYYAIDELAKENNNVKVCGDLSLNWVMDVYLNTAQTLLYKFGLNYKKTILDKNNQVFGNKTHIENGVFVKTCTRKNQVRIKDKEPNTSNIDKILLDKYAAVIKTNESYSVPIKSLPENYSKKDLVYKSSRSDIASVSNGVVYGIKRGASEITITTSDGKYSAALNILVSDS